MIKEYNIVASFKDDKLIAPAMVFVQDDNLSTQLNFTFEDEITDGQNVKLNF